MPITTFSIVVGTEACDAKCPFCVSAMTGFSELPACRRINEGRFAKAARLAQLGGTTTVLLTGKGEPTLYPDEIGDYLLLLRPFRFPFVEVQTNGLLLGRPRRGRGAGKPTGDVLGDWLELGLNTVAISVVGVRPEHNRAVYAADYPDLSATIAYLHRAGFSVRLCVMMHKGFVDRPEALEEVVAFCKANGVEKLLTLRHGDKAMATVYDVDGQNLALSDCLAVGSTSDALRTLIFYSDGRLTYGREAALGRFRYAVTELVAPGAPSRGLGRQCRRAMVAQAGAAPA